MKEKSDYNYSTKCFMENDMLGCEELETNSLKGFVTIKYKTHLITAASK